jgi:RHS repeat-associated protein
VTEIQRYANGKNNAEDMCQRVTYSYDTNPYDSTGKYQYTTGRLTAAVYPVCNVLDSTNVSVTEMYSYHPAGAVTIKDLHIYKPWRDDNYGRWVDAWGDVEADYTYNLAGQTSSLVLPSTLVPSGCCASVIQPVTYTYGYDGMARPVSMVDNNPNSNNGYSTTWAQNVQYDFAGRLTNWQRYNATSRDYYGNWVDVSVAETLGYNANSQLTSMSWSYQNPGGGWGAASGIQYVYSANQNNGQITQAVESWSGQNISYQYDALKRLISAASTPIAGGAPTAWTETMQYDGFGNLTAKVLNGATTSIPVNGATNRLSNASYDANGNMISGAGATLGYDEANRIVSAAEYSGGTEYYAYAPDGKRMFRQEADGVTQEWTFWGARGEKLGTFAMVYNEYVGNDSHPYQMVLNPTLSFAGKTIWDGGKPLVQDRIGTNRATGARYYPFGDEITSTANDAVKFGTYRRDGFTGLDYADQRYYASLYGRFNSPDPYMASGGPGLPGSWNRYSYVLGDPVNLKDSQGLYVDCDDDDCSEADCDGDPISCLMASDDGSDSGGGDGCTWNGAANTLSCAGDPSPQPALAPTPSILTMIWNGIGTVVSTVGAVPGAVIIGILNPSPTSEPQAGSIPTVAWIEANCTPVGPPVIVPAKNYPGGQSIEQHYVCPDGNDYTIHTLTTKGGKQKEKHPRPGKPKYGPKPL